MKSRQVKAIEVGIFFFGCFVCASIILLHKLNKELFWTLAVWEGFNSIKVFEIIQFAFYSTAFLISVVTYLNLRSGSAQIQIKLVVVCFSIGVALLALEEVSYGQKFMPIETPDVLERINLQKEITIHNVWFIQPHLMKGYFLVSMVGSCGFILKFFLPEQGALEYLLVDWFAAPCFALCLAMISYARWVKPDLWPTFWVFHETFELLISSGFLSVSVANYVRIKQLKM